MKRDFDLLISWLVTFILAFIIFYLSSVTLSGPGSGSSLKSSLYHFAIFFIFAMFLFHSILNHQTNRLLMLLSVLLALIYALSDEIHQYFVPGRFCSVQDILIDAGGILLAFLVYLLYCKLYR